MESIQYILIVLGVIVLVAGLWWLSRRGGTSGQTSLTPSPISGKAGSLGASLRRLWSGGLDESSWESLEELLLSADVGVTATHEIVRAVRDSGVTDPEDARAAVTAEIRRQFRSEPRTVDLSGDPSVMLIVGVNGTGKTTTIAKLAHWLTREGRTVLLGAADTFRAAAAEQLTTWGDRLGVQVVRGSEGGDPASVAFDAVASATAKDVDVVLIDTAGRLHGKKNLMAELSKIHRVAGGEGGVNEALLILDATAGQNGLAQVREFAGAVPLTGIVLTKLDGTARGGIVVAVERELGVPVKFVGVGERIEDLEQFDPDKFVAELMEMA